ncbi:MAG: sulfite exporter TauE/SafE family protein [Synechococcaceae cyanobacterium]|nr:sulfite exporter TauE/SafE family protein [Synechococcaceae cyanobacterium]
MDGAGLATAEAVPLSLLVVMLLAAGNLAPYLRRRQFAPQAALFLGLPALAGSWIGGSWVKAGHISEALQLEVFSAAAVVAAWLLTRPRLERAVETTGSDPQRRGGRPLHLAVQGLLVGLLTGIAGVGASLLLIALNALVAFAALGHWPAAGLALLLPLLVGGALGAVVGQGLAPHLSDRMLRQGFAAVLLGSALLTGAEALHRQGGSTPRYNSSSPAANAQNLP